MPSLQNSPKLMLALVLAALATTESTRADEVATPWELSLADGALSATAPGEWLKVKPRNRIIEAEIKVPASSESGDTSDGAEAPFGRLTVMAAGGSVDANIARWRGQFRFGAGDEPTVEKAEVNGMAVTWFDAAGTFLDSPRGPFGPKVEKADHRMLAAIMQTGGEGNYFFKLVGPTAVIDGNADAFKEMVESVEKTARQ